MFHSDYIGKDDWNGQQGNPDVHVILRGGSKGPNYAAEFVRDCSEKLRKAGLSSKIMVRLLNCYRRNDSYFHIDRL